MEFIETIETYIKKKEPRAKELSYTSDKDNNLIVKYKVGNKKNEININNSMYNLTIAWPDKEILRLQEEYNSMREKFDKAVKEATKWIREQYQDEFKRIQDEADKNKKEIDKLTHEFLESKLKNYFSK